MAAPVSGPYRGSVTLADHPGDVVRLACDRCGRSGQYRKATLLTKYPADTTMPSLLHLIAQCARWEPMRGGCGVHYVKGTPDEQQRAIEEVKAMIRQGRPPPKRSV